MKRKKIWTDPSFWVLMGINAYLIVYYYRQPTLFTTLIWLYWAQSMLMGTFNVLDLLTVRKVNDHETFMEEGKPKVTSFKRRIPTALFFMFHFGLFHLGYFCFLVTMKKTGPIDWEVFRYFFYAFLAGQIIGFIQHKVQQWKEKTSLSRMLFVPYIRIVPMHLTIILSNFVPAGTLGIFLILKAGADVLMYIVTKQQPGKNRETETATIAMQQRMNM